MIPHVPQVPLELNLVVCVVLVVRRSGRFDKFWEKIIFVNSPEQEGKV